MIKNDVIRCFRFLFLRMYSAVFLQAAYKQPRLPLYRASSILRTQRYSIALRFLPLLLCIIALPFFSSCAQKADRVVQSSSGTQKKELSRSILFVLGKDFSRYSNIFTYLTEVYTPESLKAKLSIISYSDMTARTKQPRLSLITEHFTASPADILISLGIPEGGARILRTIKEKSPALHIFSLLPVEEILPLEAYSDIVVDFELPDSFTKADRAVNISADDIQTLVLCIVTAAEQIDEIPEQEPFTRFVRAASDTAALLEGHGIQAWGGTQYKVQPYRDPELNIRSYNYLILSPPAAEGLGEAADGTQQGEHHE